MERATPSQAITDKLKEIYEYGKKHFQNDIEYDYAGYEKVLNDIADHFNGFVENTGGHVLVTYIPTGDIHFLIGVTDESVVIAYHVGPGEWIDHAYYSYLKGNDGKYSDTLNMAT